MPNRVLIAARVFDEGGPEAGKVLTDAGCEIVYPEVPRPWGEDELVRALLGISGVIAAPDAFTDAVFARSPDVKVVSRWGVGYDTIDVGAATRHGVVVATTPGTLHDSVADLVFGLMLSVARNLPLSDRQVREGTWKYRTGQLVWGKRLGIVGLGTIGKAVARRARGFNMAVVACDVVHAEQVAGELGVRYVSLDELLSTADFVTLHANLTEDSVGMIDEAALRRMKSTACLINAGRGALVDQPALVKALQDGAIAGAGLDVFEEEPLPKGHPLTQLDNCVLTPHCGSFSIETIRVVSRLAALNVAQVLSGERCPCALNPEVYDSPALRAPLRE